MPDRRRPLIRPRVLAICVAIGIAIGVTVAVVTDDSSTSGRPPARGITVTPVAAGTPGPAAALWLLGAATIRVPPRAPGAGSLLAAQAFGAALGGPARVDLFDPASGAVGLLDARTNELRRLAPVAVQPGATRSAQPVADSGDALWLATGPGQVTRVGVSPEGAAVGAPSTVTLPGAQPGAPLVFAGSGAVWTASHAGAATTVTRIDPATGETGAPVSLAGTTDPVALGGDDARLFVVFPDAVVTMSARTEPTRAPARVRLAAGVDAVGAVVARGRLWALDRARARIVLVDPAAGTVGRSVAVQGVAPPLRPPFSLAADARSVFVLAPATGARLRAGLVTAIDPVRGTASNRFTTPARLEIGAIALSTGA